MTLSTHVLDAARGQPASGVPVHWESRRPDGVWAFTAAGVTDDDGRLAGAGWLTPGSAAAGREPALAAGQHRLVFDTGAWYLIEGLTGFFPEVVITFTVTAPGKHHHVPLLLSPYAYSTYRGS
jgi:5-hydroxyisourate hydrolase